MRSRLFLISSILAQPHFTAAVSNLARGAARAAVVTTAEPKLKERNRNAVLARETLLAVGVPEESKVRNARASGHAERLTLHSALPCTA